MTRPTFLMVFACCFVFASSAQSALTLSLTPSETNLGHSGGTVTLTGSVVGDNNEQLLGYDLFWDISGIDLNSPGSPITLSNPTPLAFGGSFFSPLIPAGSGRDFGISNTGLTTSLNTSGGLDLFTIDATFAANSTTDPITFDFLFAPNAIGSSLVLEGNNSLDMNSQIYQNASVTVSAVPEPSSLAILTCVIAGGFFRFRQQRRRTSSLASA